MSQSDLTAETQRWTTACNPLILIPSRRKPFNSFKAPEMACSLRRESTGFNFGTCIGCQGSGFVLSAGSPLDGCMDVWPRQSSGVKFCWRCALLSLLPWVCFGLSLESSCHFRLQMLCALHLNILTFSICLWLASCLYNILFPLHSSLRALQLLSTPSMISSLEQCQLSAHAQLLIRC